MRITIKSLLPIRKYLLYSILILAAIATLGMVQSPGSVSFNQIGVFYEYGENITFQAEVNATYPIEKYLLTIRTEDQKFRAYEIPNQEDDMLMVTFPVDQLSIPPFSRVEYWIKVVENNGEETISETKWFDYEDNRFEWQSIHDDHFLISWYDKPASFGNDVLMSAQKSLYAAQQTIPTSSPTGLKIYVYNDELALQESLRYQTANWIAAHAEPQRKIILLSTTSSSVGTEELERQLSHEITHILQYELTGDGYTNLPIWLIEGSASMAELNTNPQYTQVLQEAFKEDTILPLTTLCKNFPSDASLAFQAYAQSKSFAEYLTQTYGSDTLVQLFMKYAENSADCNQIPAQFYQTNLNGLENQWKAAYLNLDEPTQLGTIRLDGILLVILITLPLLTITVLTKNVGEK